MPKQPISTDRAPAPAGSYSQATKAGGWLYVAGQGPLAPDGSGLVGSSIEEQTAQALANVEAILKAGGAGWPDVVKATVHLSDAALFKGFNAAYSRVVPDPVPARTTVASGLPLDGMLVEIDVVAYVGE